MKYKNFVFFVNQLRLYFAFVIRFSIYIVRCDEFDRKLSTNDSQYYNVLLKRDKINQPFHVPYINTKIYGDMSNQIMNKSLIKIGQVMTKTLQLQN